MSNAKKMITRLLLLGIFTFVYIVALPFYTGFWNSTFLFGLCFISTIPVFFIALFCLIYQIYMTIAKRREQPEVLARIRLLTTAISLILVLGIIASPITWPIIHTVGFTRRLKKIKLQEKLPEIRKWIAQVRKPTKSEPRSFIVPRSDLLPCLRKIDGDAVWLEPLDADWITWKITISSAGGGFIGAGWGVVIGPENIEIPETAIPLGTGAYIYPLITDVEDDDW